MIFALDIGGTYIKYAHIDQNRIVRKGKWETTGSFSALTEHIEGVICRPVSFIGISSGGFWAEDGQAIGYETIQSTSENNLKNFLAEKYGCPVSIENDARCALLAEKSFGVLQNCQNAVLFVLGSSLGCAVLVNGKLFLGSTHQAGAMFLMPEYYDGSTYRYDQQANSIHLTKEFDPALVRGDMRLLEDKALHGDPKAKELLESYSKAVALKCWYAYLAYDPEQIALGGGIANSKYITQRIRFYLNGFFVRDKSARTPVLSNTHFGEESNLLGAALLARP